jgi:hypothetical protein
MIKSLLLDARSTVLIEDPYGLLRTLKSSYIRHTYAAIVGQSPLASVLNKDLKKERFLASLESLHEIDSSC